MTENQEIGTALLTWVSIAGLWWLFFWRYRALRVDEFRQKMFALRDQLFDEAAAGLIQFDHPAYGMLRSTMNGFIRFGHKLGWLGAFLFSMSCWNEKTISDQHSSNRERWEYALATLNSESRNRLQDFSNKMNFLVLEFLVVSSPITVFTVVVPAIFFVFAQYRISLMLTRFRNPLERIDSAALVYGRL